MGIMNRVLSLFQTKETPKLDVDTQLTEEPILNPEDRCDCIEHELNCRRQQDKPKEDEARSRLSFMKEELRTLRSQSHD